MKLWSRHKAVLHVSVALMVLSQIVPNPLNTVATAADTATVMSGTRDKFQWPFARDSIWNMPIGSGAQYVPASLALTKDGNGRVVIDPEHITMDPNAPIKKLNGTTDVRVDPALDHNGSWNGCSTLLLPGNTSAISGQPLTLAAGGNPSWRWTTGIEDLKGQGHGGCHGGSHLSGLGGTIRKGEMTNPAPFNHALKINLYCARFCSYTNGGYRWPATSADSYASTGYKGTNSAVKMGSLLALKPTTDLSFITSPQARKMAEALRDYGAYVVDDTYWDVYAFSAEEGETWGDTASFHAELQRVITMLNVVDNNTATTKGGGGTPRRPLAPCFKDDIGCTSTTTTTAALTAATPTSGGTYVSDMAYTAVANGWGPVEKDRSNGEQLAGDGTTLTIGGKTYSKGLGTHAGSEVKVATGPSCTFSATVGLDAAVAGKGSVVFQVFDGTTKVWDSGLITGSITKNVSAVIPSGALRLVVTDGGDGVNYDHADWGFAKVVCTTTTTITAAPTTTTTAPATTTTTAAPLVKAVTGTTYVSDLAYSQVANGWGPVEKDRSNGEQYAGDGSTITVGGRQYAKGFGVNAWSEIRLTTGRFCTFSATVGIDAEVTGKGSVGFQVFDGSTMRWDSGRITGSTTKAVSVTIPTGNLRLVVNDGGDGTAYDHADWADAKVVCPTVTYLTNMAYTPVYNGWGPVEKNRSNGEKAAGDGRTITIGGKTYTHGLGVHAGSHVTATIGAGCRFSAIVGLDAEVKGKGSVVFKVYDGSTKKWDSGLITGSTTKAVSVSIPTGKLRLVVTDGGNGKSNDHADWADAKVTCG